MVEGVGTFGIRVLATGVDGRGVGTGTTDDINPALP